MTRKRTRCLWAQAAAREVVRGALTSASRVAPSPPTHKHLDRLRQEAEALKPISYIACFEARRRFLLAQGVWYEARRGQRLEGVGHG
jgi:hypothetical protein